MKSTLTTIVTATGAGTFNSETITPSGDIERLALLVVVPNANALDVTLQGSIGGSAWVDTAISATALNNVSAQIGPTGGDGTIFAVWTKYRLKVVAAGANSITAHLIGLGGS